MLASGGRHGVPFFNGSTNQPTAFVDRQTGLIFYPADGLCQSVVFNGFTDPP